MTMTKRDNFAVTSPGLEIGTTTSKVTTGLACAYNVEGRVFNKAATADVFTLAGTSLAARQTCAFFLMLGAAGAASVVQSPIKEASTSTSTTTRYVPGAWDWPDVSGKTVVGAVVINSGASAFIPGTTALTGVATYVNAGQDYGTPIAF